MSQAERWLTRIEIHPGAKIGRRLFINHGMGRDGNRWRRRPAVSGRDPRGTGKEHGKRYPTIENKVVVGGRAKILGNIVVGKNCLIGAGSVLLRSVPDDSTVVGVPGHIIFREGKRVAIPMRSRSTILCRKPCLHL